MTDPPLIYDPPRNAPVPPRPRQALILAALFNLVALVLMPLGYGPAAHVFVALAFVTCVVGVFFASRSQTPTQKPPAPTAGR